LQTNHKNVSFSAEKVSELHDMISATPSGLAKSCH